MGRGGEVGHADGETKAQRNEVIRGHTLVSDGEGLCRVSLREGLHV